MNRRLPPVWCRGSSRPTLAVAALAAALLVQPLLPEEARGQFGRNRVRHEPQDFRLLRTSHVDLYHPPELEAVARDAARLAERAYVRLSRVLQHDFRERIPVLLYGSQHQFQQTNALMGPVDESTGGATEFFKRRVVLPFTGSWGDFEHVLVHELVHAFQLDILYRGSTPEMLLHGPRPPLWFMEGMAEYLTARRVDPRTAAWVRDGVLTGYLQDGGTLDRKEGYLSYRFGQAFWAFVADGWGEEAVGEILQRVPRLGLEGAFIAVTGRDPGVLAEDWAQRSRREVLTALVDGAGGGPPGLHGGVRPLTLREGPGEPWTLAPSLSPDGRSLVFLSTRGGESFDLWLADGEGEPIRRLVRGGRSPGLESLRFMSSAPAFSPDGGTVAFTAKDGGRDALLLLDPRRGRIESRIRLPLRTVESPSWSPDSRTLVVSGADGGASDLWLVDRDGTGLRRLTDDRWANLHPAWSPDGRWIAFATDRGPGADQEALQPGAWRIALLDVESGEVHIVPGQTGERNLNPVWSPDGRHLAWVGEGGDSGEELPGLFLHDRLSGTVGRLAGIPDPVMGITPASPVLTWSRAGPMVLTAFRAGGYLLHRVEDPLSLPSVPVGVHRVAEEGGTPPAEAAVPGDEGDAPEAREVAVRSLRDESLRRAVREGRPLGTLRALLDSVEAVLPDAGAVERHPVRTRLTPDLVGRPTLGAQVGTGYGNGLYGGAAVSLSDILGNHRVVAGATLNGSLRDAAFQGGWLWSRNRWDLFLGAEQIPFYRWMRSSLLPGTPRPGREDVYLREVGRRATLGVRYPFSTFRRVEVGVSAGHESRDLLRVGFEPNGRGFRRTDELRGAPFVQGSVAWVHDDTRWGWNGPVGGKRARLELLRSTGGLRYDQLRADLRGYAGLPGRSVLATRLHAVVRTGEDSDLRSFYWGGPGAIRGWGAGSFRGSTGEECRSSREAVDGGPVSTCPIRDQLVGSSGAVASVELRIPVIREVQLGGLGRFPPVELLLFSDAGAAWSRRVCSDGSLGLAGEDCSQGLRPSRQGRREAGEDPFLVRTPVGNWGAGVRLNLLVVQAEIHHARPLNRPGRGGVWGVVLGPPF